MTSTINIGNQNQNTIQMLLFEKIKELTLRKPLPVMDCFDTFVYSKQARGCQ